MASLSSDQRHLLGLLDPCLLFDALLGADGAKRLMDRQGGACGFDAPEGAPAWMTSYETRSRVIMSPMPGRGPVGVTVSAAQLIRFGAGLSERVRAQMLECLRESRMERLRVLDWCHCGYASRPRNAHSGPCSRHHPAETEQDTHYAVLRAVAHRADTLLDDILALDATQLALFS